MNVLIIGNGQIGQAIAQICLSRGDQVEFFTSKEDRSQFIHRAVESDAVFLAIPTRDTGETALSYLLDSIHVGKPVITCEKGALAYHFDELKLYLNRIGLMASVGGGSRMMSLFAFPHIELKQMVGVVNGTLNYLFSV